MPQPVIAKPGTHDTVWVLSDQVSVLPAMNEYAASDRVTIAGWIFYVLIWVIVVLLINYTMCQTGERCWVEPLIGFLSGALLLYLEHNIDSRNVFYFLFPDRSVYSTTSPDEVSGYQTYDYAVVTKSKDLKFTQPERMGYVMSDRAYAEGLQKHDMKAEMLDQYLDRVTDPMSGKEARLSHVQETGGSYGLEMSGLSRTAYYVCMIMVTWGSYVIKTKWGGPRTLIFTVLAVLIAIGSTASVLQPTNIEEASRVVFSRRLGVHMATGFAASALASGFFAMK